jgi:hypothetical protein
MKKFHNNDVRNGTGVDDRVAEKSGQQDGLGMQPANHLSLSADF